MNQPGNPQNPGQGLTVIQLDPPAQGQPQFGAPPQYVAASPPGVAVQLPGPQSMVTTPGYPSAAAQGYTAPVAQPVPQSAPQPAPEALPPTVQMKVRSPAKLGQPGASPGSGPARPRASSSDDQLLPGAGRTVYEFTGAHSEEARSGGKHQTFIAEGITLTAPIQEERHTNLSRNGGVTMFIVGLAVVGIVGALAYFLSAGAKQGGDEQAATEPAATPEPAPQAPVEAPVTPPPVDPAAVPAPPVDPAAAGGGAAVPPAPAPAPEPAPAPADDATPPPADDPKPADEPVKKKSTSPKKKSAPPPEPEPEKKKKFEIVPHKPPRGDGLDNLPSPD